MERLKGITIIVLLASGLFNSSALGKSASALLQEGLYAEETEGDLDKAIEIYEKVVEESKTDRLSAEAMYRLGMCYLKSKDEQRARAWFEKVIAEHGGQEGLIEKVRPLLAELSNPDPASLMPADTKIYVEFGSPGKQIDKILQMLKGTAFENPLAALGGGAQEPGEKKPGDVLAALMNPSMMAEFKKIRGMAIGITGIQASNPPLVAVLFPGKSDALRGIILAGLGVALQPGEPIEGMQTLVMPNQGGAAYDDDVIIISQPMELLVSSVKRYKGLSNEQTLISKNKVFSKISRKAREDSALTIWLNGAATFAAVSEQMADSGQMAQLRMADGIADFENMEELVAHVSIREDRIAVEANVGFKNGHNCLAYDLIRTPNLGRDGFKAVPSQAVGVASFALSEAEGGRAQAAQKVVKKLTGLDIGREIFANIEQVNLFALPPGPDSARQNLGAISCFGLAITSKSPQQTRQLLTEILTVADLVVDTSMGGESSPEGNSNPVGGRYKVAAVDGREVYCYMDQVDNTTILALSPWVLEASLAALKSGQSALVAGPLRETVSELPPETSKMVLVNAGGAIRIADSHINWVYENPENPIHELLGELARAFDSTSVQLRTEERLNSFSMRKSVDNIPALGPVFPLLMQAAQIDMEAKAKATSPEPAVGTAVGAGTEVELSWQPGIRATKHSVYYGTSSDALSLMAEVESPVYTELPALKEDTTYYWRIDEVWADGSVIIGDVWSFTTGKIVGWWKFDEDGGNIASDASGSGYNAALNNMDESSWVDGVEGKALRFDGLNDYVSIPALGLNSNTATITAWIKRDGQQAETYTGIVCCRDGSTTAGISFGKEGDDFSNINHELAYNWNETYSAWNWHSGLIVPDNEWVFIALVVEPKKATMYLGEKGTLSSAINKINHEVEEFDGVTRIGHDLFYLDIRNRYFKGEIDDVRISNYALSEEEVKALYKSSYATNPQPADGAVVRPENDLKLDWTPGTGAVAHKGYFGADSEKLALWDEVEKPPYAKLQPLEKDTDYFWRIDEVQEDGSVLTGNIWSFNTGKLIAWWKLDESQGRRANDSAGDNVGILQGDPGWISGRIGSALEFDGVDDYVDIGRSTDFGIREQVTIAAWIKTNDAGNGEVNPYVITDKYGLKQKAHNVLEFYIFTDTWYVVWFDVDDSFNSNWHHLAGTYDGRELKLYIDGVLEGSTFHTGTMGPDTSSINIGARPWPTHQRYYDGAIDDVRIYNYALGEDEIRALCKKGKKK